MKEQQLKVADKKEHHSKVQKVGMTLIMNKDFH